MQRRDKWSKQDIDQFFKILYKAEIQTEKKEFPKYIAVCLASYDPTPFTQVIQ